MTKSSANYDKLRAACQAAMEHERADGAQASDTEILRFLSDSYEGGFGTPEMNRHFADAYAIFRRALWEILSSPGLIPEKAVEPLTEFLHQYIAWVQDS
jgi:hypothetical protein